MRSTERGRFVSGPLQGLSDLPIPEGQGRLRAQGYTAGAEFLIVASQH
jgi:hypothetical protein